MIYRRFRVVETRGWFCALQLKSLDWLPFVDFNVGLFTYELIQADARG